MSKYIIDQFPPIWLLGSNPKVMQYFEIVDRSIDKMVDAWVYSQDRGEGKIIGMTLTQVVQNSIIPSDIPGSLNTEIS